MKSRFVQVMLSVLLISILSGSVMAGMVLDQKNVQKKATGFNTLKLQDDSEKELKQLPKASVKKVEGIKPFGIALSPIPAEYVGNMREASAKVRLMRQEGAVAGRQNALMSEYFGLIKHMAQYIAHVSPEDKTKVEGLITKITAAQERLSGDEPLSAEELATMKNNVKTLKALFTKIRQGEREKWYEYMHKRLRDYITKMVEKHGEKEVSACTIYLAKISGESDVTKQRELFRTAIECLKHLGTRN